MPEAFVDTDVIVRMITGDDPVKQAAAIALFEKVESGELTLRAPVTVIADAVYVLGSRRLYGLPRADVREMLDTLVNLRHFDVENRRAVIDALEIYEATNLDFGDAMIAARIRQDGLQNVFSYDHGFDRLRHLVRVEP
jgi:predicted nucleic-acid-binding protein